MSNRTFVDGFLNGFFSPHTILSPRARNLKENSEDLVADAWNETGNALKQAMVTWETIENDKKRQYPSQQNLAHK